MDSTEIRLRTGEGSNAYPKYEEKKPWMLSNTNKSSQEAKEIQKDIPSFNLVSN